MIYILEFFRRKLRESRITHTWIVSGDEESRQCSVCQRIEEFDIGGGMQSPVWYPLSKGDLSRHQ